MKTKPKNGTPVSYSIDRLEKTIAKKLGNDDEIRKQAIRWLLQAVFVLSMPRAYPDPAAARSEIRRALTRIAWLEEDNREKVGNQP